jgi:hypothetical protein
MTSTTCSTCFAGSHAMPEPMAVTAAAVTAAPKARHRRRAVQLLAAVVALLVLVALPATVVAAAGHEPSSLQVTIADAPPGAGEDCVDDPDAHPGVGLQKCETPFSVLTLLPFVAGGVVVLLAIFVGWYLVMRRRASRPFLSDEAVAGSAGATGAAASVGARGASGSAAGAAASADWWTCRNCGSTNMVGSARCYKCGSWQR